MLANAEPGPIAAPFGPDRFPETWRTALAAEFTKPYFQELSTFVARERERHTILPPADDVLNAFQFVAYHGMKVLLLGQDPYPGAGQAHGLCFSVRPGTRIPPSLANIFTELRDDLGCAIPKHGCLEAWARQGVLMLNAVLTVRAGESNSHAGHGWELFTDAVIAAANEQPRTVFVLWGAYAQKKMKLIDSARHAVIQSAHPSPLSARHGFFGSKPFSKINAALREMGHSAIDWQIPPNDLAGLT